MPDAEHETSVSPLNKFIDKYYRIITVILLSFLAVPVLLIIPMKVYREKAYLDCRENVKAIGWALEMYSTDNAGHYPQELKQLTPKYLKTIPTCPKTGSSRGYEDSYIMTTSPDAYTFYCKGDNHTDVGIFTNRPSCSANEGLYDGDIPGIKTSTTRIILRLFRKNR